MMECHGFAGLPVAAIMTSVASALATADVKNFACREAGLLKIHDRIDDVGDLARAIWSRQRDPPFDLPAYIASAPVTGMQGQLR